MTSSDIFKSELRKFIVETNENLLPNELWKHFFEMFQVAMKEEKFLIILKDFKTKSVIRSWFMTKKFAFPKSDKIQLLNKLQTELKDKWRDLATDDQFEFQFAISHLSLETGELLVQLFEHLTQPIKLRKKEVKQELASYIEKKKKVLSIISDMSSKGTTEPLPMKSILSLITVHGFTYPSKINLACLEYFSKLISNPSSKEKFIEQFGEEMIAQLKQYIKGNTMYARYFTLLKTKKAQSFFMKDGLQRNNQFSLLLGKK